MSCATDFVDLLGFFGIIGGAGTFELLEGVHAEVVGPNGDAAPLGSVGALTIRTSSLYNGYVTPDGSEGGAGGNASKMM